MGIAKPIISIWTPQS